ASSISGLLRKLSRKVRMAHENLNRKSSTVRGEIDRYRSISEVLAAINNAKTAEEATQAVIDQICIQTGWSLGHAYTVDEVWGRDLISSSAWHLEQPEKFAAFRKLSEESRLSAENDFAGQVLVNKKPIWVDDCVQAFDFPRTSLLRDLGLRVGFTFPVL